MTKQRQIYVLPCAPWTRAC